MKFLLVLLALWLMTSCGTDMTSNADTDKNTLKPQWIAKAFETLTSSGYPQIKAISWWHENWENEDGTYSLLRLDSSPAAVLAYQAGVSNPLFVTTPQFEQNKLVAADEGMYHAAFPDFGGEEDNVTSRAISDFETLAQKEIVWAYFSDNWMHGIRFPSEAASRIRNAGKLPFIRMMPRSQFEEYVHESTFTLSHIINGDFDANLTQWARDAKVFGSPLLIEFGTEMNGEWFSWNALYNGKENGGSTFQNAYRHIIDIFKEVGADNVTWFFHINAYSYPQSAWNSMENYYPGDDYIDWLGVSIYGALETKEPYQEFQEILDDVYPTLVTLSANKPIAVLEFAITEY